MMTKAIIGHLEAFISPLAKGPENADLILATGADSVELCINRILDLLRNNDIFNRANA